MVPRVHPTNQGTFSMLRVDPNNPKAVVLHQRLAAAVNFEQLPETLCVAIGGDGWMLQCIQELGPQFEFLGLNAGHLGFLLNDTENLDPVINALNHGTWETHLFPMLELRAERPSGDVITTIAANDIYVERRSSNTAQLSVTINDLIVVERMVCDGIIVSTGLGSTAYGYSAGGLPCHPLVRAIQVTPICPHAPRLSPVLLPIDATVIIQSLKSEIRPVAAVADGVECGPVNRISVGRAKQDLSLAFLSGHHFTRTLIRKILRN